MFGILKQAKEVQKKLKILQEELESIEATAQSGGGLVTITLIGKGTLKEINIDPSLLKENEKDVLEDLIVAAHTEAKKKLEEIIAEKSQSITEGLPIPPGLGSLL
ncbi:YbaB/EbfC family nucleoid-associated protein [Bartonella sp. DGB1]|uniref:YbaB/EbfC family nucleoid-associated protein n=1 Tax=Bartonella sp. DGB1 TaxID=3239807 RepID=UPI003523CF92